MFRNDEAVKIDIKDILEGDLIRVEYKTNAGILSAVEFVSPEDGFNYTYMNATHYLLKREHKPLPTKSGTIIRFDGLVPLILSCGEWFFVPPIPQSSVGPLTEEQVWERAARVRKNPSFTVIYEEAE